MTARKAGPPGGRRREADGNLPLPEAGYLALDQPRLVGPVKTMAGLAGAPFGRPVDVQVMQIAIAVAEIGPFRGPEILDHSGIVTGEAQGVALLTVGRVELLGKFGAEQCPEGGAVRVVTAGTLAGGHGSVLVFAGGNLLLHGVVATEAHRCRRLEEHPRIAGAVRIVAGGASAGLQGSMREGSLGDGLAHLIVTAGTQGIAGLGQHIPLRAVVRIVAIGAAVGDDGMNLGHSGQRLLVVMAHETKVVPGSRQLVLGVGGMNVMTGSAVPFRHRAVDVSPPGLVFMTLVAEGAAGGRQHGPGQSAVGTVAGRAVTFPNGSVRMRFAFGLAVVAPVAQRGAGPGEHPSCLAGMRIVAQGTLPGFHRTVKHLESCRFAIVAPIAKGAAFRRQHLGRRSAVRVVTGSAPHLENGMDMRLAGGRILVTGQAQIISRGGEHSRGLAGMRIMAGGAPAGGRRRVQVLLPGPGIVVTAQAEFGPGRGEHPLGSAGMGIVATGAPGLQGGMTMRTGALPFVTHGAEGVPLLVKKEGVIALVRAVALGAAAFQDRMDVALPLGLTEMALAAQLGARGGELEGSFFPGMALAGGLVAGGALLGGYGAVHEFGLPHDRMAIGRDTAVLSLGRRCKRQRQHP